jgi:hypothetical protein
MPEENKTEQTPAPTYEELINMPLPEEDARKQLAEIEIQLAQCNKEKAAIDQRIADIVWVRQVILRQALNRPGETKDGSGK